MFTPDFKVITFTPEVVTAATNLLCSAGMDTLPENTIAGRIAAGKLLRNSFNHFTEHPIEDTMLIVLKHSMIVGYLQALQDNKLISIPKDEKLLSLDEARVLLAVNLPEALKF